MYANRDFSDIDILKKFRESLVINLNKDEGPRDQNLGLSLREMIHEFKYQTLVLFKALLLQPKVGSCHAGVHGLTTTDLREGEHVWALHTATAAGSAGRSRHKVLDEDTINISSPSLRSALALSVADRRWIDLLAQIINDTWDEAHPEQPKTHGYMGSEEFIRLQFEEYLLALLSCMKYHEELDSFTAGDPGRRSRNQLEAFNIEGDPALEFNAEFLELWQNTSNYALFKRLTSDALLFSIVEPRHPCAGGLTIDDVQRRLSQQVADLHLDERVRESREALNRHISTSQKKVSAAFNNFWSDIESMREAQRKKNEEKPPQSHRSSLDKGTSPPFSPSDTASIHSTSGSSWFGGRKASQVDISSAQASVSAAGQRAGAYLNSWSTWASEKRKEWQEKKSTPSSPSSVTSPTTPTLASINEPSDLPERGRRSMQACRSEDTNILSRSGSRRKRWSNIFLKRDSGEYSSANSKDDGDSSEYEAVNTRSQLSKEVPCHHDEIPHPIEQSSKEPKAPAEAQKSGTKEEATTTEEPTEQPSTSIELQASGAKNTKADETAPSPSTQVTRTTETKADPEASRNEQHPEPRDS
ncbi:late secretory pathway protein avl9 [Aspergillus hancockii]|nr:late secretory pathway protein avl9 [Aspergillus hancockii]